jgi:uncharacterized protein YegP (UPF0339 family)
LGVSAALREIFRLTFREVKGAEALIPTGDFLHAAHHSTSHGMRFEYWQTADGVWAWHLKSSLGDVIARSAPFHSRETCLYAIKLVKLAAGASCQEITDSRYMPGGEDAVVSLQEQSVSV